MKKLMVGVFAAVAAVVAHAADDWYVDLNSSAAEPDGKSWDTAFRDVQSAIDAAATGNNTSRDTIYVAPGRYCLTETLTCAKYVRFIGVTGKALKNGAVPESEQVILDGQNAVPCLEITRGDEIHGITFVNGRRDVFDTTGKEIWGGGALNAKGSSLNGLVVSNCIFRNCVSGTFRETGTASCIYGGGVGLQGSAKVYESLFEDCGITNGCPSATPQYAGLRMRGGAIYGVAGACSGNIFRRNFISDPLEVWQGDKVGSSVFGVGPLVDNCLFESNYFNTATAKASLTMGVEGSGHTFSNLVFRFNEAPAGVGFRTGQGCVVTHCSFIGNRTTASGFGCLNSALSDKASAYHENLIRNCLFLGNYAANGTSDNSGTCIHTHFGDSAGYERRLNLRNCAFVGNVSDGGAGGQAGQTCFSLWSGSKGAYLSISNCWFEANLNATNSTWCNSLVSVGSLSNYLIEDCVFKDNESGKNGSGGYGGMIYGTGGNATDGPTTNSAVRNCAFINNKAHNVLNVSTPVTDTTVPGITIENCTIAGNRLTSTTPAIAKLANASYRMFVYNTALCDNKNDTKVYNLGVEWADHVFTSYIGPQDAARTVFEKDGNVVSDDAPLFVDAAKGDYRLQKRSPLVDAGQLRPWIDTVRRTRKASQADLSAMAAVYDAAGSKPGCDIVRTKIGRRLEGALPDIGAYEYYCPPGLLLMVR